MIQTDVKKFIRERALKKKRKLFGCLLRLFIGGQVEKEKNGQPREIKSKKTDENKN